MKTTISSVLIVFAFVFASCGKSTSSQQGAGDLASREHAADYYTCPMHPQVRSDKPGICPICHMDLVKASNSADTEPSTDPPMVSLTRRDQLLANVSTAVVGYERVEPSIRAFGTLSIAESRKTMISARFSGRIEKLVVDAVGARVKKGQPLFDVYSPDIIQAEHEYRQTFTTSLPGRDDLLTAARTRLVLLGLTEGQIRALEESEVIPLVATYSSPASGIVIEKNIVEGVYVSEGMPLYDVSDMAILWNIADVYESDAGRIHPGDKASLTTSTYPDRKFPATVSFVYPVVNPQSRTVKVRLTVNNAGEQLKPNMYTETVFLGKGEQALTVPVSAVLITGKRNLVYVKEEHENHFEAREIGLGARFGEKYAVLWGLSKGKKLSGKGDISSTLRAS